MKQDYIIYRMKRALEKLNDAKLLANSERWNSCVNRLYYACFYAVNALLIEKKIEPKTHKGVKVKFFYEFIRTGIFYKKYGKLYTDLHDWRNESDYSDFFEFDKEIVNPVIEQVENFLNIVQNKLSEK